MTNDERREVAARLRWIDAKDDPGNTALMLDKIRRAIGVHMNAPSVFPPYEWLVTYAHVTLNRLADLIEPEERTCERGIEMFSHAYPNEIVCDSDCVSTYVFPLTCGHEVELLENKWPSYCPHCGARVVADD